MFNEMYFLQYHTGIQIYYEVVYIDVFVFGTFIVPTYYYLFDL